MYFRPQNLLVFVALFLTASSAYASDFTRLNDAADDYDDYLKDTYDAFDFSLEPTFTYESSKARITREGSCATQETVDNASDLVKAAAEVGWIQIDSKCQKPQSIDIDQLNYTLTKMKIDFPLRLGLYKDLEFRVTVPYIVSSTTRVEDIAETGKSLIYPETTAIEEAAKGAFIPFKTATNQAEGEKQFKQMAHFGGNRLFNPHADAVKEVTRSGVGDPSFGLHWGIYNDERDDTKAALNIGLDYTAPIAPMKEPDNDAVGEGMHQISFSVSTSKRFTWFEPYFGFQLTGRFARTDSPLAPPKAVFSEAYRDNDAQIAILPPQSAKVTIGTEFVAYENKASGQRYAVDLAASFEYRSIGRDYSPLYDQFVKDNQCTGKKAKEMLPNITGGKLQNPDDVACSWLLQQPSNSNPPRFTAAELAEEVFASGRLATDQNPRYRYNGIATVDGYTIFTGRAALHIQPVRYVMFDLFGTLGGQTNHLITGGSAGRAKGGGKINLGDPTKAKEQRDPVFNHELDEDGRRFKIVDYVTWQVGVKAALMF